MQPWILINEIDRKVKIYSSSAYSLLILAYVITTGYFIIRSHSDFAENTFDYFLLLENWRQPTISDIIPSENNGCPSDFSPVIPYVWPGTKDGCLCKDSISGNTIKSGSCKAKDKLGGCSNVDGMSSQSMPQWAYGALWCVKLNIDDTFLNRAGLVGSDGGCSQGYIKCGSDVQRVFCSAASKCPINSIIVSTSSPGSNYKESVNFKTYQGDNYSIYWSREEGNSLPIVEWRVSEEEMCLNNKNNYLSDAHSEYILMNNPRVKCKELDNRFITLDWMSEKKYFESNNKANLPSKLPGFSLNDNINWKLYFRGMIDFKIECRYLLNRLANSEQHSSDLQSSIHTCAIVMSVFLFLVTVLNWIAIGIASKAKCFENEETFWYHIIVIPMHYILRIICIAISATMQSKVKDFASTFNFIKGKNCSDDLTNSFFSNLSRDLDKTIIRDLNVILYFNIALVAFDFTLGITTFLYDVIVNKNKPVEKHSKSKSNFKEVKSSSPSQKKPNKKHNRI